MEDLLLNIEKNHRMAEEDRLQAGKLLEEARETDRKSRSKLDDFEKQRDRLLSEARKDAKRLYDQAREETDLLIKELNELRKSGYDTKDIQKLEEARTRLREGQNKLRETSSLGVDLDEDTGKLSSVIPGQQVLVASLNQKGSVLSAPDKNGEVQVQVGIMKINASLDDLRAVGDGGTAKKETVPGSVMAGLRSSRNVSLQLDIRGKDAISAIEDMDKYLDDVAIAGLKEVTIVHGKGTGALRNAVHQHLKTHSQVKEFRLGRYGEGENGVTIVTLI
jgi:DNA mismatch repair protein MutS2